MIANPVWGISRSNTSHVTSSWVCCVFVNVYVFFPEMTSNNLRILLFLFILLISNICCTPLHLVLSFPRVLAWDPMGFITILQKPSRESICWSIQVRPWMFLLGGRQPKVMEVVSNICLFSPLPGEMMNFDEHIFSNGLVQPPTSKIIFFYMFVCWGW